MLSVIRITGMMFTTVPRGTATKAKPGIRVSVVETAVVMVELVQVPVSSSRRRSSSSSSTAGVGVGVAVGRTTPMSIDNVSSQQLYLRHGRFE